MKTASTGTFLGCAAALGFGAAVALLFRPNNLPAAGSGSHGGHSDAATAHATGRPISNALQESIRNGKGAARWLQLLATLEAAKAEDMAGLIRVAAEDPAMVRMLAARWAELDPDHMFRSLHADYMLPDGSTGGLPSRSVLTDVLFQEWTKSDLKAAVKALTDVPEFSGLDNLRMSVSNRVMQVDVEEGLRVLKAWSVRNYTPDMRKIGEWAAKDPRHAVDVVLQLSGDYAATEALKQIGKVWAQSDPLSGLTYAAGLPAGQRSALGTEIIQAWAERDVKAAAEFASNADPALRSAISRGLVSAWGKTDPAGALAWSEEHLNGASRADAISSLVKAAAEKDLNAAAELVSGMQAGTAQNQACASIFEAWFKKGADQRDAAFAWLAGLPDADAQKAALERVQWEWAWRDPQGVKEFITGPHGQLASRSMVAQVARSEAARNPQAAMEWARSLPASRAAEAKQAVFDHWLNVRPQGAAEYATTLPAGPERETAIRSVCQTLVYQSPKEAVAWYRKLPSSDQQSAREMFERAGLPAERQRELNEALKSL